ncbi:MAG: 8-oxo-dGTP diphosphatase [Spirochaetaceae bacterium]|nr:MAG: 8-oxo-dGTP diphosphatase [Spirochaetaceae bacterium]
MERYPNVDWPSFAPSEHAVLLFTRTGGRLLLIHKKRGLGAGKVSAPGGRIEPGERAVDAAIRETTEELGITPHNPQECALLDFAFRDGFTLRVTVFLAESYTGTPRETDEAIPLWTRENDIPYGRMWEDDREWLPLVLSGRYVRGRFEFDGDAMLSSAIDVR